MKSRIQLYFENALDFFAIFSKSRIFLDENDIEISEKWFPERKVRSCEARPKHQGIRLQIDPPLLAGTPIFKEVYFQKNSAAFGGRILAHFRRVPPSESAASRPMLENRSTLLQ